MPGASEAAAGSTFVDTNIWVDAPLKVPGDVRHPRAVALVEIAAGLVISPQVVAEYDDVMLRNAQTDLFTQANLRGMFARARLQPANADVVSTALALRNRYGFSAWSCQIAAAALQAGCDTLLTDDLQHGQVLEGALRVLNPLRDDPVDAPWPHPWHGQKSQEKAAWTSSNDSSAYPPTAAPACSSSCCSPCRWSV